MSARQVQLLCQVVEDNFGIGVRKSLEPLVNYGPLTLPNICKKSGVSVKDTKKGLQTLIQHNCVRFEPRKIHGDALYSMDSEVIMSLLRYSKYCKIIEDSYGTEGRTIMEAILCAGQICASKLLYMIAVKSSHIVSETAQEKIILVLKKYFATFEKLAHDKYIKQCGRVIAATTSDVPVFENDDEKDEIINIPSVNFKNIYDAVLSTSSKISELDAKDATLLWKINVSQFNVDIKDEILVEAMEVKTREPLCAMIFKAVLAIGRPLNVESNLTASVSVPEIKQFLNKLPKIEKVNMKYFDECLKLMTKMNSIATIFMKVGETNGGQFVVDIKEAFRILTIGMVEKMVESRFGYTGGRMFRLIRRIGYVDQDSLIEKGMMSSKLGRNLLYKLAEANYVTMKEMRKTYTIASSVINKVVDFVFHVEFEAVLILLLEESYHTMKNSRIRLIHEKEKYKRLLEKEKKVAKILYNMKKTKCTDEQLKEVNATLTIPERQILLQAHEIINKLTSGQLHAYRTIFTIDSYFIYHQQENS